MMLITMGWPDAARAVLMCVAFYFRPGEVMRLRGCDLVEPLPSAGPAHARWSITMHVYEDEQSLPSKTNEYDESLQLDLPKYQFLAPVLMQLKRTTAPRGSLWKFDQREFASLFREAGLKLGLSPPPMLYQLRHSGASLDFAAGDRDLLGIKRRGRWRSDTSLRRYEKGGRVTSQLQSLPHAVRAYALESARRLLGVLAGRLPPLRFHG